ncbi:MAG: hypothetical protein IPP71_16010 [Bacteroidetes bacterium]|nr:hypothetical protein [Bacteroidota bacterium]
MHKLAERCLNKELNEYNVEEPKLFNKNPKEVYTFNDTISNQLYYWFNSPVEKRNVSPNSSITTTKVVEEIIKTNKLETLLMARFLMPSNINILNIMSKLAINQDLNEFSKIWGNIYSKYFINHK